MTYHIVFDLGGTTFRSALMQTLGNDLNILYSEYTSSLRGLATISKYLELNCAKIKARFSSHLDQDLRYILSMPGNIQDGYLLPDSGRQLESVTDEFQGLHISAFTSWDSSLNWSVFNDAETQTIGGIYQLLKTDKYLPLLLNKLVLYVGPGTGLGGGFAYVDDDGNSRLFTDGHIYDICLNEGTVMAEDLVSGRAFYERTGISPIDLVSSEALLNEHIPIINDMGQSIAELIYLLKSKQVRKWNPVNQWTELDCEKASDVDTVILGGSMGTKAPFATYLFNSIEQGLAGYSISMPVLQLPNSDDAAFYGAVLRAS